MNLSLDVDPRQLPWEYDLSFVGQTCGHNPYIYNTISRVLTACSVDRIIEIGTQRGGLTLYLALWGLRLGVPVYTFDIEPLLYREVDHVLAKMGVQTYDMDVFSEAGVEEIRALAKTPTYLVCDGGDKEREFETFAPMLPTGSVISVHDWGTEVQNLKGIAMQAFEQEEWTAHDQRLATVVKLGNLE